MYRASLHDRTRIQAASRLRRARRIPRTRTTRGSPNGTDWTTANSSPGVSPRSSNRRRSSSGPLTLSIRNHSFLGASSRLIQPFAIRPFNNANSANENHFHLGCQEYLARDRVSTQKVRFARLLASDLILPGGRMPPRDRFFTEIRRFVALRSDARRSLRYLLSRRATD